jgi:hypothetical protein
MTTRPATATARIVFDFLHTAKAVGFPDGDIRVARFLGGSNTLSRGQRHRLPPNIDLEDIAVKGDGLGH